MMTSDVRLKAKIRLLEQVEDEIPAIIIVTNLQTQVVAYLSPWGCKLLAVTLEEIIDMGAEYNKRFFNPDDAKEYLPIVLSLLQHKDEKEVVTFFQQVRSSETEEWKWYLTASKIFFKDENGEPTHFISYACPVDPLHNVTSKMNRLLEEKNYLHANKELFASFTKREKEILRYMASDVSSLVVAEKLFISENTVNTHRRNIRSKLKMESNYDITRFAQAFNLI